MDSNLLERFEAIARTSIAEDVTPEFSLIIKAVVAALAAAKTDQDLASFLVCFACFTGQATKVGIHQLHRGAMCEQFAMERITDFGAGLGLKVVEIGIGPDSDDDEDDDEAELDDVTIASVH